MVSSIHHTSSSIIVFDAEVYDVTTTLGFFINYNSDLARPEQESQRLEPPRALDVCELGWRLDIGGEDE